MMIDIAITGRPGFERDFLRQSYRNPIRCHRITVARCTTTSALRHSFSIRITVSQKMRSRSVMFGRPAQHLYTAS